MMRRRYLGFVYQFHHLLPEFSAIENVMMPQLIAGVERTTAAAKARKLLHEPSQGGLLQPDAFDHHVEAGIRLGNADPRLALAAEKRAECRLEFRQTGNDAGRKHRAGFDADQVMGAGAPVAERHAVRDAAEGQRRAAPACRPAGRRCRPSTAGIGWARRSPGGRACPRSWGTARFAPIKPRRPVPRVRGSAESMLPTKGTERTSQAPGRRPA